MRHKHLILMTQAIGILVSTSVQAADIEFFLIEDHAFENSSRIEIPSLGIEGWWSGKPILTIQTLKNVNLVASGIPWTMIGAGGEVEDSGVDEAHDLNIEFDEQMQARFKDITSSNIDKRLMLCVGDTPLMAPVIRMPIETLSFKVQMRDGTLATNVYKQLRKLTGPLQTEQPAAADVAGSAAEQ